MTEGLRIVPLGGLGEIGMNCMAIEYRDEVLVVDCGLQFSDLDHFGIEFAIPRFDYLRERADKIKAFIITHGHEDHMGALPFAFMAGLKAPIFASDFTSRLIRERIKEYGFEDRMELRPFTMGGSFKFRHFQVQTVPVNHSIIESSALIIDTPVGRIVHTGDFKIDPAPFYGKPLSMEPFEKAGAEGVLLLLSDSTNVERHTCNPGENVIYEAFERLFALAEGITIVSMFSSSISRIGQVLEVADKMGKKVAVAGRSMEGNVAQARDARYLKSAPNVLISLEDVKNYPRKDVIIISTGAQGEYRAGLSRVANGEHRLIKVQKGDRVILSARAIPGNEKDISRMINSLFRQGADVLYEAVHQVHVSGHATRPELARMIKACKPKYFVPIHGEYRHLVHHGRLAEESGVAKDNVIVASNGDVLEFTDGVLEIVDHLEETRTLIEDRKGREINRDVLKDRRKLAEIGVVFVMMVREPERHRIVSGPDIITRGVVREEDEGPILEKTRQLVLKAFKELDPPGEEPLAYDELEEEIRIRLRRYFDQELGKKPTVVPVIMDV